MEGGRVLGRVVSFLWWAVCFVFGVLGPSGLCCVRGEWKSSEGLRLEHALAYQWLVSHFICPDRAEM